MISFFVFFLHILLCVHVLQGCFDALETYLKYTGVVIGSCAIVVGIFLVSLSFSQYYGNPMSSSQYYGDPMSSSRYYGNPMSSSQYCGHPMSSSQYYGHPIC